MSVVSRVKRAVKAVKDTIAPDQGPDPDADILDTLGKEHDEVQALLSSLQDAEGLAERRRLVQKIKHALVPHTKAEEKIVYDALIALRSKNAKVDGKEGYIEHELAARTLRKLEQAPPTSPDHKAAGKVLKELIDHHIKEEENNVWRDVKDSFSDEERTEMNRRFLAAKKKVKLA
jgi:hemerythrin-like domain-containing protein